MGILQRNQERRRSVADLSESWSSDTSERAAYKSRNLSRNPSVSPDQILQANILDDHVAVLQNSNHQTQTKLQRIPHAAPAVNKHSLRHIKSHQSDRRTVIEGQPALQAFLSSPDITTLLLALEEAIALPIYMALLYLVADGDPMKLRLSILGKDDPGPSGWTFTRCCELMIKYWDSFTLLYGSSIWENSTSDTMDIDMTDIPNEPLALHQHQSTASHALTTSITSSNPDRLSPERWMASLKPRYLDDNSASNIVSAEHGLQHLLEIATCHSHFHDLPSLNDKLMNDLTTSAISVLFLGPECTRNGPAGWWLDDSNRICIEIIVQQLGTLRRVS